MGEIQWERRNGEFYLDQEYQGRQRSAYAAFGRFVAKLMLITSLVIRSQSDPTMRMRTARSQSNKASRSETPILPREFILKR